tara:strand:- start:447 stop:1460 length:1014 start_codon:yes stop_codon:yes gene_type:complete
MFKLGTKVDDMLKAWTKADDAARIEGTKRLGLPDNNTAADRAKAMGFSDETHYHGTNRSFDGFDLGKGGSQNQHGKLGIFTSTNPKVADKFAEFSTLSKSGAPPYKGADGTTTAYDNLTDEARRGLEQVYPLKVRLGNTKVVDSYDDIGRITDIHTTGPNGHTFGNGRRLAGEGDVVDVKAARNDVFNEGYESISLPKTMVDAPGKGPIDQYVHLNTENIRSPLAHFNPKMAGIGAGAILSANLMADELDLEHKPKVSAWDSLMNTIGGVNQQQAQAYGDTGAGAFNLAGDIIADPSIVAELGMKGFKGTGLGAILQSNEVQAAEKPDFFQQLQRKR